MVKTSVEDILNVSVYIDVKKCKLWINEQGFLSTVHIFTVALTLGLFTIFLERCNTISLTN